jgi:prolyl 4-hydroxylase
LDIQPLSANPEILLLRDFISPGEIRHLLARAVGHFDNSKTVCHKAEGCVSSYRTSATASLLGDDVTRSISRRACEIAGLPYAEEVQIVRYFEGQEFKPHFDAFNLETPGGREELLKFDGRQRDATFLIYLSGPEVGGATRFTELGLDVAPIPGAAVYWRNILADGSVDPRSRHAGMPVLKGVKYACNLWLRGRKIIGALPPRTVAIVGRKIGDLPRRPALGLGRESPLLAGSPSKIKVRTVGFVPASEVKAPRLGKFAPTPEEDAKRFGVKLDRRKYTGTRHTLQEMARMIRNGSASMAMRQFAEAVVRNAGVQPKDHIGDRRSAEILLEYVRSNVRYRPDPDQIEYVQSPEITLCVPGANVCIPIGDCDDFVVALGSLMGAYGIAVKVMKQTFDAAAEQEHVLIIFRDAERGDGLGASASGDWLAADPTVDRPIGWRAEALKEEIVDPVDPSGAGEVQAEYVGVGAVWSLGSLGDSTTTTDSPTVPLPLTSTPSETPTTPSIIPATPPALLSTTPAPQQYIGVDTVGFGVLGLAAVGGIAWGLASRGKAPSPRLRRRRKRR